MDAAKNAKGDYQPVGSPIVGRAAIANAVRNLQSPVGGLTSEHHVTSDPLVEIHGNTAHLNIQFLTYAVPGRPARSWCYCDDPRAKAFHLHSITTAPSWHTVAR